MRALSLTRKSSRVKALKISVLGTKCIPQTDIIFPGLMVYFQQLICSYYFYSYYFYGLINLSETSLRDLKYLRNLANILNLHLRKAAGIRPKFEVAVRSCTLLHLRAHYDALVTCAGSDAPPAPEAATFVFFFRNVFSCSAIFFRLARFFLFRRSCLSNAALEMIERWLLLIFLVVLHSF